MMVEQAVSVEERIAGYLEAEEGGSEGVEERQAPAAPDSPVQAQEEPTEATPETEGEPEVQPEVKAEEEVEEIAISKLSEWADHDEIDMEAAYSITVPVMMPNGDHKEIPIGQLKDSHQAKEYLDSERTKFSQERAVFEQEIGQKKQAMDAAFFTASKVLEDAESALMGNWNDTQMNELRVNDPAEYALALTERDRAKAHLESKKTELKGEYEKLMNTQQQEAQAQQAQSLQAAYQALPQFIPEWADEKVATQEKSQLVKYGLGEGYTEQELSSLVDPRVVRSLRKAMMYDAQQKAAPAIKKKVVSIGKKVIKGGKSQSKTERQADIKQQDYKRFRQSGGSHDELRDAAAFIDKHLLGDL